jgi:hypothetical protein
MRSENRSERTRWNAYTIDGSFVTCTSQYDVWGAVHIKIKNENQRRRRSWFRRGTKVDRGRKRCGNWILTVVSGGEPFVLSVTYKLLSLCMYRRTNGWSLRCCPSLYTIYTIPCILVGCYSLSHRVWIYLAPLRCWKNSTKINGFTSLTTVIFIVSTVRTSHYTGETEVEVSDRTRRSTGTFLYLYSASARFDSQSYYWAILPFLALLSLSRKTSAYG